MYRHSVYLNMIYVDVNGPLTRFNWIVWAQIIYKKKNNNKKLVLLSFYAQFVSFFKVFCRKSIYRILFLLLLSALVPIFVRFGSFHSLFV